MATLFGGANFRGSNSGGSSSDTYGAAGEVLTHSELPAANEHTGEVWRVKSSSGVWPLNKAAGRYQSGGSEWHHLSGEAELAEQILANQQPTFEDFAQNTRAYPQLAPVRDADGLTIEKSWQGEEGVITLSISRDANGFKSREVLSGAIGNLAKTTKTYIRDSSGQTSTIDYS